MPETKGKAASPSDTLAYIEAIERFSDQTVLIFGDVMLDEYLSGSAERISPEAPVPVVRVDGESRLAGGAGNVARNIRSLGAMPLLIAARGNDDYGASLERCLQDEDIGGRLLTLEERTTTIKTRVLARQQQVVRIDREDRAPIAPEQMKKLLRLVDDFLPSCRAVVISDYGKGMICRQSMSHILEQARKRNLPVLVDPKPCNFQLYKGATLLTPNAKETGESVNMPVSSPIEIIRAGRSIMQRLGCKHLVTTLGSLGMAVFEGQHSIHRIPTMARQVFDVTGAGDTVISTLALGAAAGVPLVTACLLANYAAGLVVAKVGAATASPNQLAEAVATLPRPEIEDWSHAQPGNPEA